MSEKLSKYKYRRLSTEAFKNGLRLHFDSILLFKNKSFPSAFQLSVLALEEFSKSNWVEHYFWTATTNNGFPDEEFEQEWLKLLYFHPRKQKAFFGWRMELDYSPKFVKFVRDHKLESKKQYATYVGLEKQNSKIDVKSRISIPTKIKELDAKQIIAMINDYLLDICSKKITQDGYFCLEEKDTLITLELQRQLNEWKHKSGLRSKRWFTEHLNNSKTKKQ